MGCGRGRAWGSHLNLLNRGELYARRAERERAEASGGGRLDGGQRRCFVAADAHPLFGEGIADQVAQGDGAAALRRAVDDATPNACRFFEEHGECGADMPCNPKERIPTAACCTANGCSGVYRLPPLAIPAEFRVARGDGSMMESLLANRSAALLAASDEYL